MLTRDLNISKRQLFLLAGDLAILVTAPFAAVYFYVYTALGPGTFVINLQLHPSILLNIITFTLLLYFFDQYNYRQDFRRSGMIARMALLVMLGSVCTSFVYYALNIPMLGRSVFVLYGALLYFGFVLLRLIYSTVGAVGRFNRRTLVVGCGDSGRALVRTIRQSRHSGLEIMGFLERNPALAGGTILDTPVFLQNGSLSEAVQRYKPQVLIVAMGRTRYYELAEELTWCAQHGIEIWDVPTAFEKLEKRIPLPYVDEIWLLYTAMSWPKAHTRRLKRLMDIVTSILGLFLSLPLMVLTGLAILLESGRPIILVQKRLGIRGRTINAFKFRSMYQSEPEPGDKGTCVNDDRVTHVGRIIRKMHIDELPQLINVLRGDLSMVGPRAELIDFIREYIGKTTCDWEAWDTDSSRLSTKVKLQLSGSPETTGRDFSRFIPYIEQRFTVNQGITGWAQVMHPYVTSSYEDMAKKLEYDLYYIKNMSLTLDMIILFMTARLVLMGKGK